MLSFHFDYSLLHCIKTFKFIRSHVFIFVFISITLGCRSQRFMSKRFLTMFSSKIYKASGLIFRYLTHFEFIFVYGVRKCSSFFFFSCRYPVFPASFTEETVISLPYIFPSYCR